ncbi:OmpA family protein [Jannaschia aquimarina]|nr:OmpA family protein [Jannaschia aquimarina]
MTFRSGFAVFAVCWIVLVQGAAEAEEAQSRVEGTIADALSQALSELPDPVAEAARLQRLDAIYTDGAGRWEIELRHEAEVHRLRIETSGEMMQRVRTDPRGADAAFWASLPAARDVAETYDLDGKLADSRARLEALGFTPDGPIVLRFRQPGPGRAGDPPRPYRIEILREILEEDEARRLLYEGGVFERMTSARQAVVRIPSATAPAQVKPPEVTPPTATAPTVEIPVVDLPEAYPPIVDLPDVSLPGTLHEDEDIALIRMPGDILFAFDRADLRPDAEAALSTVLDLLESRYPDAPLTIHGHTDAKGSDAYNLALSEARAASVREWLDARGIAPERMSSVAHGEARPVAPNTNADGSDNPAGRQANRRVEIAIKRR